MTKPQEVPLNDEHVRAFYLDELKASQTSRDSINNLLQIKGMRKLSPQEYEALEPQDPSEAQELLPPTGEISPIEEERANGEVARD